MNILIVLLGILTLYYFRKKLSTIEIETFFFFEIFFEIVHPRKYATENNKN